MGSDIVSTQKTYYSCILQLWQAFKTDLVTVQDIKSADDPRWESICDHYEKLVADAPAEVRDYADSMMRVHIYELEKCWRWKDDKQQQTA